MLNALVVQSRQPATYRQKESVGQARTERDHCEGKLNKVDPCDKDVWRSSVRSAMRAASQLPGREPTDVDDAPTPAS